MESWEIWIICAAFVAYALVSRVASRWLITAPMVFIGLGFALSSEGFDVVQLGIEKAAIEFILEVTLAIVLFSDASRLRFARVRHHFGLPLRLLGIGLPLTVAVGALIVFGLLDGVSFTTAALVAAVLAPTDAALGQPVVTNPAVPANIREALNVESGLNDGLALPIVTVLIAMVAHEQHTAGFWVGFMAEQVCFGVSAGVVIGAGFAWLLARSRAAGWIDPVFGQLSVAVVPILAYAGAETLDGNGFISAFVAGIAFAAVCDRETERSTEFTEDSAQLFAAAAFFMFGNIVFASSIHQLSWSVALCALMVLTIGRMAPVAIAMIGSGASVVTVGFVGWFGPRGLASIVFGLTVAETELIAEGSAALSVIGWTVVASVVLHGMSAGPGARRYGRWWSSHHVESQESMMESNPVEVTRVRWSARESAWPLARDDETKD